MLLFLLRSIAKKKIFQFFFLGKKKTGENGLESNEKIIRIIFNVTRTFKQLRILKNYETANRFLLTMALILMTPIVTFVIVPILQNLDEPAKYTEYIANNYFVFTQFSYGYIFNFIIVVIICFIWGGNNLEEQQSYRKTKTLSNYKICEI
ncbi:hypothetical protein PACTADRAFT_3019 [Pachysolen tannophilus NRRL Y-2460]|uniref:Uncharacterized protein n=1 Tax=Pachysolen tannophilus NRRL Y-2460 TaxID=669874 RepID=A0A1E4TUA1_PACTA|nr:hypothetical protein PACTADRAFT_3019 [Pachysolen tannophilus NRRL Y-2460]